MNKCLFIGRCVDDPKQFGEGDGVVSSFRIAVDRPFTNAEGERETDFPSMVALGKQSHLTQNSLSKGTRVGIEGRYQTRRVVKDGETKYYDEFVVERYTFIDKKKER